MSSSTTIDRGSELEPASPAPDDATTAEPWNWIHDGIAAVAAMALALIGAFLVLQLWDATRFVPLNYSGDANFTLAVIKGTLEHGWYLNNSDVGAPFGLQLQDFASFSGDNANWLFIKILGVFFSTPAEVMNAFYVLTYPASALSAFIVMRALGISRPVAVVTAVLFALAPYHFLRSEYHLFLATSWSIPLGIYLVLSVMTGRPLFERRESGGGRVLGWASRRSLLTLLCCVLIACASLYYAVFTLLLLVAGAGLTALARRSIRPLVVGALVAAAISAVVVVNLTPNLVFRAEHGTNELVAQRQAAESETYAMKLTRLLMPVPGHRIEPLRKLQARYQSTAPLPGEGNAEPLGTVGAIGLLGLLLILLLSALGMVRRKWSELTRSTAVITLVTLLLGMVGGFSSLFAYVVSGQIRAWNRISIVIAFLALIGVALALDWLRKRLPGTRNGLIALYGGLAALLLVAYFDQTDRSMTPNYGVELASYQSDHNFVKQIDHTLPKGAMVFQLPYIPFPEAPAPGRMIDYDLLRGYLHSDDLRWSYGAMKGRPRDWSAELADEPLTTTIPSVAAAGFQGIYVDTFAFPVGDASIPNAISGITGAQPMASKDGRLLFWDIRPYAARLRAEKGAAQTRALGDATLHPLRADYDSKFYPSESDGKTTWRWAQKKATLDIVDPSKTPRAATFSVKLDTGDTIREPLTITYPDGSVQRVVASPKPILIRRTLRLKPGDNKITFSAQGDRVPPAPGDARVLYVRLLNPIVRDPIVVLATAPPTPPKPKRQPRKK